MPKSNSILTVDGEYNFPRGFTISDNRIEDMLQRLISPAEYVVWRQYLRFWGSNKKKAYPSLSYLSQVTGLSEKTIRKCNKALKQKEFLGYITGGPGRSNVYTFRSIPLLIKKYYGSENASKIKKKEEEDLTPIRDVDDDKVRKIFEAAGLSFNIKTKINEFADYFSNAYSKYYGYSYEVDERDAKKFIEKSNEFIDNNYNRLIDTLFKSQNTYIKSSDHSIYFFFSPGTQKTIIAEYNESDTGRWSKQANIIWSNILSRGIPETIDDIESWIRSENHLAGANKIRDEYVVALLVEKIEKFLER